MLLRHRVIARHFSFSICFAIYRGHWWRPNSCFISSIAITIRCVRYKSAHWLRFTSPHQTTAKKNWSSYNVRPIECIWLCAHHKLAGCDDVSNALGSFGNESSTSFSSEVESSFRSRTRNLCRSLNIISKFLGR